MSEIAGKFKRQIEILGIAINNMRSLGTTDLAHMYGCERLTIKRDLQEMRSHGIDIHSEGRKGVRLAQKLGEARARRVLSSYLALGNIGTSIDKASALLVRKRGEDALSSVVVLQMCIEGSRLAKILYESERRGQPVEFTVTPLRMFQADELWRLLAVHEGTIKQFLLTKVLDAVPGATTPHRVTEEEIEELFRNSFRSWTGIGRHQVRLRLSREWAVTLKSRHIIMFDTIREFKGGGLVVEGTVNSLVEIAGWIVSRGKGVTVEAPKELEDLVVSLAKGALSNYE